MCFFVVACDSLFKGEVNEVLLGDVYYLTKVKFLTLKLFIMKKKIAHGIYSLP